MRGGSGWKSAAISQRGRPAAVEQGKEAPDDKIRGMIDRLTKWIPGDVLALYVAAATAFAPHTGAKPSSVLLIVFIVLSAPLGVGGAFASTGEVPRASVLPAILAAGA